MNECNISSKWNNTTMGVLIGIFTGLAVEVLTNEITYFNIIIVCLCFLSAFLLLKAIQVNDAFLQKCISTKTAKPENFHKSAAIIQKEVLELDEYKDIHISFKKYLYGSFTIISVALVFLIFDEIILQTLKLFI